MQQKASLTAQLNIFWLINCLLYFAVLLHYFSYVDSQDFSFDYYVFLSLSQAGFVTWICLILLPVLIYQLSFKKLNLLIITFFFGTIILFLVLLDQFIYSQYHLHLNWTLIQMVLSPARTQIFSLTIGEQVFFFLVFFAVGLLQYYLLKLSNAGKKLQNNIFIFLQAVFFLLFIVMQSIHVWADAVYEPKILSTTELIPWFHGATAKRFLARHHWVDANNMPAGVASFGKKNINYPLHSLNIKALDTKFNIVMIVLDAWRADSFAKKITPNVAAFSENASIYHQHFSGGNNTRAGIFSLFYSIGPNEFESFYKMGRGPVLFEVLAKQGYKSGAYTSASAVNPPFHRTVFVDLPDFRPTMAGNDSVERDRNITAKFNAFIRKSSKSRQPFFGFVFYDSAHAYNYPPDFKPLFQPSERISHLSFQSDEQMLLARNQYNNALNFIDRLVGEILVTLQQQSLLDKTIVIITADHGEEFNDNQSGFWGHNGNFTRAQTQVPLIIYWPNQRKQQHINYPTSHYDIIPTLLSKALGVTNKVKDYSLGIMLDDKRQRQIILMGSYNNTAIYSPSRQQFAVTNALGYFQMQDARGKVLKNTALDANMIGLAYQQMRHFLLPRKL